MKSSAHSLLGKCKTKLQQSITSQLLDDFDQNDERENTEKWELLYNVG